jgi:hypothetical protein
MIPLPPVAPSVGLNNRIRLARDYYVRVDTVDYSVDPRMIGRFVDVSASPQHVVVRCAGRVVAEHARCWAKQAVITDPAHVELAAQLRRNFARDRAARDRAARDRAARDSASRLRQHADGHTVALRALPDYDALFGVDFTPTPAVDAVTDGGVDSALTGKPTGEEVS